MAGRVEIGVFLEGEQAVAEAAVIDQKLDNIGKSGASGTNQAKTGLQNLERAATSTKDSIARYDKEILEARSHLAQLGQQLVEARQRFGANSEQANTLKTKMGEVGAATRGLVAEKAILVAESKLEEAATNASTSAFSKKTTMINTGQGALKGYDAALTGVIRSMGGINLGLAVGISLAAALLPKIIDLVTSKKELAKATNELNDLNDHALAQDQRQLDLAQTEVATRAAQIRITGDLNAILTGYIEARRNLTAAEENERKATEKLTSAHANNSQEMKSSAGAALAFMTSIDDAAKAEAAATAERQKAQTAVEGWVAALVRANAAGEKTTDQLLEMARAAAKNEQEFALFREEIDRGRFALEAFAKAKDALRIAPISAEATTAGQGILEGQLADRIEQQNAANLNRLESARLNKKALEDLIERQRELNRSQAASAGITLTDVEAKRRLESAISKMNPGIQEQIRLLGLLNEKHKEARKERDVGPQLQLEVLRAEAKAYQENFEKRISLVHEEFEIKREEYRREGKLTADNQARLLILERLATAEVVKEFAKRAEAAAEHYQKLAEERIRDIERGRASREREVNEVRQSYARQRQTREEEERKFFETQARLALEAQQRRGRDSRREQEDDAKERLLNDERERAIALFGRLATAEKLRTQQIALLNGQLSDQQALVVALKSAWQNFMVDWIQSGEIFVRIGDAIGNALEGVVAHGESFGQALKAQMLGLLADLASYWGRYLIALGAGLFITNPAGGIAAIAAGVALLALAGVFRGLASKAQQAAQPSGGASAGGSATAAAGTARSGGPGQVIPFPTSGSGQIVVINKFDKGGLKAALKGEEFVTISEMRESGGRVQRTMRKAS